MARSGVYAAIAGGGALGGLARYGIARAMPRAPHGWPWATLLINVSGALALGLLLVLALEVWPPTRYVRPFLAVGFLGAYTTWSTFMLETDRLLAHGHPVTAAAYLTCSLAAGLAAAWAGLAGGRVLFVRKVTT